MSTNKSSENELMVSLDLGTSKVSVIVCEVSPQGTTEIIGVAEQPAQGMIRGMISNIDQTVATIQNAIHEAEMMSACEITGVFAGITGSHIRSYNSTGVVAIRGLEVSTDDINRVIEAAQAVRISSDEKILHVLPQAFTIDDQKGIHQPLGLSGFRLEAKVHVVICNVSAVQNILRCIERCDLEVENIILDPIASGYAVLTKDERDLGVGVLDIGEGTTDLAVYFEGEVHHSAVFPVGGSQITKDIAVTLQTPTSAAQRIKHQFGYAYAEEITKDQLVELPGIGGTGNRTMPQKYLAQVIQARLEEIFSLVNANLIEEDFKKYMRSGLVLTGGTSKISSIATLAEKIFQVPIRIAAPRYSGPLHEVVRHPRFSTSVGLYEFGYSNRKSLPEIGVAGNLMNQNIFSRAMDRMRQLYTRSEQGRLKGWFQGEY